MATYQEELYSCPHRYCNPAAAKNKRRLAVELQSLVYVKMEKIGSVISTEGRNPTEPMEPEFQAFREEEIPPFAARSLP